MTGNRIRCRNERRSRQRIPVRLSAWLSVISYNIAASDHIHDDYDGGSSCACSEPRLRVHLLEDCDGTMRRKRGAGAYLQTLVGEGEHANPQVLEPLTLPVAFGLGFNCKSRRLQPRPPRAEPLPEGLDCKFLPDFVSHAAASMPPHSWQALRQCISNQPSGSIALTVGTVCAGSEIYLAALPVLEKELPQRLHRHIRFDHRWSCELGPRKRQRVMDNSAPPKLFADLAVSCRPLSRLRVRCLGACR